MSTTVSEATDRAAIEAAMQLYIDGGSTGDAEKLREAFHDSGRMYGSVGGQRFDVPFDKLIAMFEEAPLGSDAYRAQITSVEQIGDAAVVRLEEEGCWGSVSFVDWFALAKIDGTWKIVNKTFAHTGGEMPSA